MPNADVSDVVAGTYTSREGRIVLQPQVANATGYKTLNPPVMRGYSPNDFYAHLDTRLNRPRYYYSTPSGLPY